MYEIEGTECVPVTHPALQSKYHASSFADERAYRRMLLASVDGAAQFYFSYGYCLAASLGDNLRGVPEGEGVYDSRFVWNDYLTSALREQSAELRRWTVPVVHGSVQQRALSCYGRDITVTLVARRSRLFAGTRFLKRGINGDGHCANDVEIEQIVDTGRNARGLPDKVASFVQLRASVPLFWGHDSFMPRANIVLQSCDPLFVATQRHFADLRARHGGPVTALSLVKQRGAERAPRECVLGEEYERAVQLVNRALPSAADRVHYLAYDFSSQAKALGASLVLQDLSAFLGGGPSEGFLLARREGRASSAYAITRRQSGVTRTNCVDCIDRSNVAQFVKGLAVLGPQLASMGVVEAGAALGLESDLSRALMGLYRDMGDHLAIQYGGSEAHAGVLDKHSGGSSAAVQVRGPRWPRRPFPHTPRLAPHPPPPPPPTLQPLPPPPRSTCRSSRRSSGPTPTRWWTPSVRTP